MLQNKIVFNQSSVSFEITGLPDYSNNENRDQISIISQWKLTIIDKPLIEGNYEHLVSFIDAFYSYTNFLINNDIAYYESKLIDIKTENLCTHNILLKSSKPGVKPLNLKIGNSVLADIVNCFDQFNTSNKVQKFRSKILINRSNRKFSNLINKDKIYKTLMPRFISLCSLFLFCSSFIYFYNQDDNKENNYYKNSKISP